MLNHLPNDRRVVLVVIGFCFGALLEGIAGFGTPVAITSSLLILVGFPPLEALVFVLIFNTAPVAFGALGVPVTVLGAVTGLPAATLGAMIGRQLPFIALMLPFYVMALYGGMRSIRALWPVLLVAGGSFALSQFVSSNYPRLRLTDVLASLGSLIVTLLFLQVWRPAPDPEFAVERVAANACAYALGPGPWQGWLPWVIVSVVVILWTSFKIFAIGAQAIPWPGLDNAISITLYNDKPYAAVWIFQPLATGTAILLAAIVTALVVTRRRRRFSSASQRPSSRHGSPSSPSVCIVGLAYLMNYSGLAYTLGLGVASVGRLVRAAVAVPRLGRGVPVGQRHVGQRAVRQSAGRRGEAARSQSGAVRGDQFLGRRDGQDDLAAEYRHRRLGDGPARARGRSCSRAPSGTASS